MQLTCRIFFGFIAAALASAPAAIAQTTVRKAPTAADWAALAKLPDFTGVWEVALGGGGGGGRAAAGRGDAAAKGGPAGAPAGGGRAGRGGAAGPSLTP